MFKSFDDFNSESNQLALLSSPLLDQTKCVASHLDDALCEARNSAQMYAQSYRQVAVWGTNNGQPQDLTSSERQSVPNNILNRAQSKITKARRELDMLRRSDPKDSAASPHEIGILCDSPFEFHAYPTSGSTAFIKALFKISQSKRNRIAMWSSNASLVGSVLKYTITAAEAGQLLAIGAWIPRLAAYNNNGDKLFVSSFISDETGAIYCISYDPNSDKFTFGAGDSESVFYFDLEPSVENVDILVPDLTTLDLESTRAQSGTDLINRVFKHYYEVETDPTITEDCVFDVASTEESASISVQNGPAFVPQTVSDFVDLAIASDEQMESLERSLQPSE